MEPFLFHVWDPYNYGNPKKELLWSLWVKAPYTGGASKAAWTWHARHVILFFSLSKGLGFRVRGRGLNN